MTYTYAVMEISRSAFEEIAAKMRAAGYDHVFHGDVIDMHGVAVKATDVYEPIAEKPAENADRPPCGKCGGPHPFDTSLPSVRWNAVIRAAGLPEYLCLTCIVQAFAERRESFTATLWSGDGPFSGLPIEVRVDHQPARDAALLSAENTELRVQLRLAEAGQILNETAECSPSGTDPLSLAQRVVELLDRCTQYGPADALRDTAARLVTSLGGSR